MVREGEVREGEVREETGAGPADGADGGTARLDPARRIRAALARCEAACDRLEGLARRHVRLAGAAALALTELDEVLARASGRG